VILRTLVRTIGAVCLLALGAWAVLALLYAGSDAGPVRRVLATVMAALTILCAAMLLRGGRWQPIAIICVPFATIIAWFALHQPMNDRGWSPDVARVPFAEIDGDKVTIHNVRNFVWRTEGDFAERWETRTIDLARLEGVDLIGSYWMGEAIAHIMVSFPFQDAPPLAVSIETRKEQGEPYSAVLGFFRRYELVYVVADERDLIGVRTNIRKDPPEDVYVYRVAAPRDAARRLFLEYVRQINELRDHPQFYNTATTNCTTMVMVNNRVNGANSLLNWKILLSGYLPQLAYERGRLDQSMPFAELRRRSRVNDAARAAGLDAPDFSTRMRVGLPQPSS
jgi:hypothetical protein